MGLTVYGTSHSRALRVLWMLEEIQHPYEQQPIGFETCAQDQSYLAINPAGTIPCIVDDGFVLAESLAINIYLSQKSQKLLPAISHCNALVTQWSLWAATSLEPHYMDWALHTVWLPKNLQNEAQAHAALSALQRPLKRLEEALQSSPFLLGNDFSVADLNAAGVISLLHDPLKQSHPTAHAWLERCLSRPAYLAAVNKP